jgi:plastocyanin
MRNNTILFNLIFVLAIAICGSCDKKDSDDNAPASPSTSGPGANEVWMQNNAFTPSSITVSAGTTIKWTNKDNMAHTVTSDNGLFDSGNIAAGGTYTRQFTTAGSYPYRCTLHSGMIGTVVVQ